MTNITYVVLVIEVERFLKFKRHKLPDYLQKFKLS